MIHLSRREFLQQATRFGAAGLAAQPFGGVLFHSPSHRRQGRTLGRAVERPGSKMSLGLVTYLWAQDWDLPALIANCEKTGVLGVELRTQHRHGVEPSLSLLQRKQVKRRFDDSRVTFVGPGTNQAYDNPDPAKLKQSIEVTKGFVRLSHDCGGSGVKVKPNDLHQGIDPKRTIEQIGRSLNVVGEFAADYGQQIRLEVHGSCSPLPIIREIMDVADHPNVGVCWNCNGDELQGKGLEYHFNLVKDRFGATCHVRELSRNDYPYQELIRLLAKMDYAGWVLLECRTKPKDRVKALVEQRETFEKMLATARTQLRRGQL